MRGLLGIGATLVAAICVVNLARIDRTNPPVDPAESILSQTHMPGNVAAILRRACQDCHTQQTNWRWYSNLAPFQWLIAADVYGARDRLNMSTWSRYTAGEKTERLAGICEMVASGKMPLWYYKAVHYPAAGLSAGDRKAVCDWVKNEVALTPIR